MQTEIIATITGKISEIANGIIETGIPLFEIESNMFMKENAPDSSVFKTVVLGGSAIVVGEIIGYYTDYVF